VDPIGRPGNADAELMSTLAVVNSAPLMAASAGRGRADQTRMTALFRLDRFEWSFDTGSADSPAARAGNRPASLGRRSTLWHRQLPRKP